MLNVRLAGDDTQQLFSIALNFGPDSVTSFGNTACAMTEKVADKIIQSLPG